MSKEEFEQPTSALVLAESSYLIKVELEISTVLIAQLKIMFIFGDVSISL